MNARIRKKKSRRALVLQMMEVQKRNGQQAAMIRKLTDAVIEMRENQRKECSWYEKQGKTGETGYQSLFMYQEDCTEILENCGVKITNGNSQLGKEYDPKLHEVIERVDLSEKEKEKDRTICKVCSDGYEWPDGGKKRIKAAVGIYTEKEE